MHMACGLYAWGSLSNGTGIGGAISGAGRSGPPRSPGGLDPVAMEKRGLLPSLGLAWLTSAPSSTSAATACEGLLGRLHDDALEFPEVSQQGGVGFPFWARVGDVALPAPRLLPVWQRLPILPRLLPALGNAAPGAEGSERLAFQAKAGASTGGAAAAARPQGRLGAKPFALGVAAGGGLATACLITLFAASRMIRR